MADDETRKLNAARIRVGLAYCAGACVLLAFLGELVANNVYMIVAGLCGMLVFFILYLFVLVFGCSQFSIRDLLMVTIAVGLALALKSVLAVFITFLVVLVIVLKRVGEKETPPK